MACCAAKLKGLVGCAAAGPPLAAAQRPATTPSGAADTPAGVGWLRRAGVDGRAAATRCSAPFICRCAGAVAAAQRARRREPGPSAAGLCSKYCRSLHPLLASLSDGVGKLSAKGRQQPGRLACRPAAHLHAGLVWCGCAQLTRPLLCSLPLPLQASQRHMRVDLAVPAVISHMHSADVPGPLPPPVHGLAARRQRGCSKQGGRPSGMRCVFLRMACCNRHHR